MKETLSFPEDLHTMVDGAGRNVFFSGVATGSRTTPLIATFFHVPISNSNGAQEVETNEWRSKAD